MHTSNPPSYVMQAPGSGSSDDKSVWAVIAIIAVLVAGTAGWAIARQGAPNSGDIDQASMMSQREGELRGRQAGFGAGQRQGNKEAKLQSRLETLKSERSAYSGGYSSGVEAGRSQAQASRGDDFGYMDTTSGAYPATTWDDALMELGDDAPGYGTPAYAGSGYDSSTYRGYGSANSGESFSAGGDYSDLYRGGSRPAGYCGTFSCS